MKTRIYTFALICIAFFTSCEDYLDKQQDFEGLDESDVFEDIRLAKNALDAAYSYLITDVSAPGQGGDWLPNMTMAGEGYPGRLWQTFPQTYPIYAQGDYVSLINQKPYNDNGTPVGSTPNFTFRYFDSWKGIRAINTFLANVDNINNGTEEEINGLIGQAYFLRAFFYHLLTKRHGGLIYLKENFQLDSALDHERESYQSNLTNMLEDLDQATSFLPVAWESEDVGRPTKGAAMALKSRLTLFAASPLVNESNDQQAWIDAATSASDLINYANDNGLYTLIDASAASTIDVDHNGDDLFLTETEELEPYRSIFIGPGIQKTIPSEVIFSEVNQKFFVFGAIVSPTPRHTLTAGWDHLRGNGSPMSIGALANFVDKFETKNGLAITDDPNYNPQEPFINRDPRFYNAILFDGVTDLIVDPNAWNLTGVVDLAQVNEEGNLGLNLHDPGGNPNLFWRVRNLTGLRIKKWLPNGARWSGAGGRNHHVNNNIFRMSEVYLNYAEAANEAYGPTGAVPGSSLTALQAINMVRNRVGMPNVNAAYTSSKVLLRERIRNERAIELCFEGIRYDDMRRWKIAHLDENKKVEFLEMRWQGGESSLYPTGFSFENVEQSQLTKTFDEKHYWWPIPNSEIEAVPTFLQTEGW